MSILLVHGKKPILTSSYQRVAEYLNEQLILIPYTQEKIGREVSGLVVPRVIVVDDISFREDSLRDKLANYSPLVQEYREQVSRLGAELPDDFRQIDPIHLSIKRLYKLKLNEEINSVPTLNIVNQVRCNKSKWGETPFFNLRYPKWNFFSFSGISPFFGF